MSNYNDDYEEERLSQSKLIDRENERYIVDQHLQKARENRKQYTAELFKKKYLPKFEHLIEKENDLDINLYSYPITKGYTGIDYLPEDKEFYFFDGTNKRKLSLEDTMTIIDIFEKGRTIR